MSLALAAAPPPRRLRTPWRGINLSPMPEDKACPNRSLPVSG